MLQNKENSKKESRAFRLIAELSSRNKNIFSFDDAVNILRAEKEHVKKA